MVERCPLCDAAAAALDPIETFTLGAGLGDSVDGLEEVRRMLCPRHRMQHVMSMATLRMKIDSLAAGPATDASSVAVTTEKG